MRFRVRGRLAPLGNAVIVKVDADSEMDAVKEAMRVFEGEGFDVSKISNVTAKSLAGKSSSVYVGAQPVKRAPRNNKGEASTSAASTAAGSTAGVSSEPPAQVPASSEKGKGKAATAVAPSEAKK